MTILERTMVQEQVTTVSIPKVRTTTQRYMLRALVAVGVLLWLAGCYFTRPAAASGWGMTSAIGWSVWVGIALTTGVVAHYIWRGDAQPRDALIMIGVLTIELYGLQPLTEHLPRTTTVWLHMGFVNQFVPSGTAAIGVDSRFSWPGFFAWWAMNTRASGATEIVAVANWTPTVVALLTAVMVFLLARTFETSNRTALGSALAVTLFNWIEQDYFSPQAVAFLLACGLLVLLLVGQQTTGRSRAAVCVIGTAGIVAVVVSHQLTPLMIGMDLLVLAVLGRRRVGHFLVVIVAAELTWFVVGASEFWSGQQFGLATNGLGDVSASLTSSLVERVAAPDPGLVVVRMGRVGVFLVLVLLAAAGLFVRRRAGRSNRMLVGLALAPATAVVQSYGGEVLMRCALFALAPLSILAAEALTKTCAPVRGRHGALRQGIHDHGRLARVARLIRDPFSVVLAGVVALAGSLVVLRGGNEAFAYISESEVTLSRVALQRTPSGGLLLLAEEQGPVRIGRVADVRWRSVAFACPNEAGATILDSGLAACARRWSADTVLVTRSMVRWGQVAAARPVDWADREVEELVSDGSYQVVMVNDGGKVLVRVD